MTYRELYQCCDPIAKQAGAQWYATAHNQCLVIGRETGYNVEIVAAVISALSPGVKWSDNIKHGARLLDISRNKRRTKTPMLLGYSGYGANVKKAWSIVRGECTPIEAFSPTGSPKTWSFWRNLLDPEEWHPVTIDRWMLRARSWSEKLKWPAYNMLAEEVRETAQEYGVLPNAVQAALWCFAREGYQFRLFP